MPPISISSAVPALASAGSGRRPESHEPSAQQAEAPTIEQHVRGADALLGPPAQHEQANADEADRQPGDGGALRPVAGQRADHEEPQGDGGDQQGGEPRRHVPFRIGDAAVAADQQQHADHHERAELARRDPR